MVPMSMDFSSMFTSRNASAIEPVVVAPSLPELVVAPVVKTRKTRKAKSVQPTVKHDKRQPVTVWYSARSVTPVRSTTYKEVRNVSSGIGAALGLTYGIIDYAGDSRIVVSRNSGASWELLNPIAPYIGSK